MTDEFDKLVELLDSAPTEQCVVRSEFLQDLDIDPSALSKVASRPLTEAVEFSELPERNMAFRDKVFVFGPKEA